MRLQSIGLTAILMLGAVAGPLEAQQASPAAPTTQASAAIDVSKLPINLSKLQKKLNESAEASDASKLRFKVDVVGQAPAIQIFTPGQNLRYVHTQNSLTTHQEMIEVATPREFRSPVMDFSNLMRWIQSTLKREN